MNIVRIGYQNNFSNSNLKSKAYSGIAQNPVAFEGSSGYVRKAVKTYTPYQQVLLSIKRHSGKLNVAASSYNKNGRKILLHPHNLEASKSIKLKHFKINGRYNTLGKAYIESTIVKKSGSIYGNEGFEAINSKILGRAVTVGDAAIENTRVGNKGSIAAGKSFSAFDSLIEGSVNAANAEDAVLRNTVVAKDGSVDVGGFLRIYGNTSKIDGEISGNKVLLARGSEVGRTGLVSTKDECIIDGIFKGQGVFDRVNLFTDADIKKGASIKTRELKTSALPRVGSVDTEVIRLDSRDGDSGELKIITKQEDLPAGYENITIQPKNWFKKTYKV